MAPRFASKDHRSAFTKLERLVRSEIKTDALVGQFVMLMMLQLQKSQGLDDEDTDSSKGLVTDHTHSSTSGSLANFVNDEPAGSEYAPEESDHSDLNMSEDEKGMGCDDSEGDPQEGNGIDGEGNDAGMAEGRGEHEDEA